MVGLGTDISQLGTNEKAVINDIKIYQETEGVHKGKWETLGPGFGGTGNQFGPELFFGKILTDSMPGKMFAFIKDAASGTYLGQTGGWLPPSSGGPGTLYRNMMTHIQAALKSFNSAYDTSRYTPRWAAFIWLQGEFDGWNDQSLANKYETNLTNLIKDIRDTTGVDDLPIIIPMIDASSNWKYNSIIRKAEIAVAEKIANCDTLDTKGLATDGIHYKTSGMKTIGQVSAIRWLAMNYTDNWGRVDIVKTLSGTVVPGFYSGIKIFDLSGRTVIDKGSFYDKQSELKHSSMMLILTRCNSTKMVKLH